MFGVGYSGVGMFKEEKFRVIIAGGRDFKNYPLLKKSCNYYLKNKIADKISIEIVSGMAKGADTLGEYYSNEIWCGLRKFKADWNTHGKAAGPIRNREVAEYCDAAIIFWDGESRGAKNMIEEMERVNKPYRIVKY